MSSLALHLLTFPRLDSWERTDSRLPSTGIRTELIIRMLS